MPKLKDFRIEFDKPGATYVPGETVSGKVILYLSDSKNVKEIRLEARGEAEVHWTKSQSVKADSGRSTSKVQHYKGDEHYFSVTNRLIGGASGSGQTTLPAGHHSYHFSFQLPLNIPCSIEHKYGHVRYTVKAILDRPWRFDHKVVSAFTVTAPYDLNRHYNASVGINDKIKRNFYSCCIFNIGGIKINVISRASGFVPGETIELIISYDNNSRKVNVTKMKMKLQKDWKFCSKTPHWDTKYDSEVIKKVRNVGPFDKKNEKSLKLEIPALPPSQLEHCSLIDINYKLLLRICVSGMHFNINRVYPIEIGTIPLNYQMTNSPQNSAASYIPSAPPVNQVTPIIQQMPSQQIGFVVMSVPPYASGIPQTISNIPPPSYEECISGSHNISNPSEQGVYGPNVQFTPKYPVYKFPMPMPYPP